MSLAEQRLREDRAIRNAARAVFDVNLAQVKEDLAARSIPGRIADQAGNEVKQALGEGLAIAKESKGIIAGTIGALLVWLFRGPILDWLESLSHSEPAAVQENPARPRPKRRKAKEDAK